MIALRPLVVLAGALALAPLLAPAARAQTGDLAALETALVEAYDIEPQDLPGLLKRFEALRQKRGKDARVEAGCALIEARLGEQRHDAELVDRALKSADRAMALNPANRTTRRAHGLAALVAGQATRKKRDRADLLKSAAGDFSSAAQQPSSEIWLDIFYRGAATLESGKQDQALTILNDALAALEKTAPGAAPAEGGDDPGSSTAAHGGAAGYAHARARVLALIGRAALERGDLADAAAALEDARKTEAVDPAIAAAYGLTCERLGDPARADAMRTALAIAGPVDVAAARALARRMIADAKTDADARQALETLAKTGADAPLAALALDLATATASPESYALRADLKRLAGDATGAEVDAREAIRRASFTARAHACLAALATAKGDAATAKRQAEIADALEPVHPVVNGKEAPVETAARAALALAAAGRLEEALEAADRALKLDATDARAQLARTRALIGLTRSADARAAAAALVKRFPDLHDAQGLDAEAAQVAGDGNASRAAAMRALKLEPTNLSAMRILGGGADLVTSDLHLPAELLVTAKKLASPDPLERAEAAKALLGDPAGRELALRQIDRDPDPFVAGEVATALGEDAAPVAVPVLRRLLRTIPPIQTVARARLVRALGRMGDPAAMPEILGAARSSADQAPGADGDTAAHAAVKQLMSKLDDAAAIRFQRELVESSDPVIKALAPVLAKELLVGRLARAETQAGAGLLKLTRLALGLALIALGVVRWRMYEKSEAMKKRAAEQAERAGTRRFGAQKPQPPAPVAPPK